MGMTSVAATSASLCHTFVFWGKNTLETASRMATEVHPISERVVSNGFELPHLLRVQQLVEVKQKEQAALVLGGPAHEGREPVFDRRGGHGEQLLAHHANALHAVDDQADGQVVCLGAHDQ